jgi:transposase-like protein
VIPWAGGAETMKASKFSDAQKAFILKQGADGMPVADICRKAGISQATYFNWKKKARKRNLGPLNEYSISILS